MRIGDLSAQTGVSVRSLRYYEEHGLLQADRTSSGQRCYATGALERVHLLRRLYGAGLSSTTIASLLPCVDAPSHEVTRDAIAVLHREHGRIETQIAELAAVREQLTAIIDVTTAYDDDSYGATVPAAG